MGGMLAIAAAATPGSASAVHHAARATPDRATSAQTTARTKARAQVTTGAALQKALNQLVAMPYGPPGVIVIVQHGRRSTVYQAGTASLADRRPLSTSDHARLASFDKTYSGAVVLSLVSSGKLRLSSTIGQVLPALPRAWHPVTLQDVLQHRSGLPDYTKSKALTVASVISRMPAPAEARTQTVEDGVVTARRCGSVSRGIPARPSCPTSCCATSLASRCNSGPAAATSTTTRTTWSPR